MFLAGCLILRPSKYLALISLLGGNSRYNYQLQTIKTM
jgi:hypothetical protein